MVPATSDHMAGLPNMTESTIVSTLFRFTTSLTHYTAFATTMPTQLSMISDTALSVTRKADADVLADLRFPPRGVVENPNTGVFRRYVGRRWQLLPDIPTYVWAHTVHCEGLAEARRSRGSIPRSADILQFFMPTLAPVRILRYNSKIGASFSGPTSSHRG